MDRGLSKRAVSAAPSFGGSCRTFWHVCRQRKFRLPAVCRFCGTGEAGYAVYLPEPAVSVQACAWTALCVCGRSVVFIRRGTGGFGRQAGESGEAGRAQAQRICRRGSAQTEEGQQIGIKKKINAQLEGLDVLEKLIHSLIRNGLGTLDKKEQKLIQEHVKQMGNYYLSGAQSELRRLALVLSDKDQEKAYTYAVEQLAVMNAIIKKGRQYLASKLEDPDMALDHESTIEEWLGHAWQLTELQSFGLVSEQAELIQLSFLSYADDARLEHVDIGYWIQKDSGEIHRTIQYRPYKAAKLMREEDSFFEKARIPVLYRYPGDMNRRVRFEEMASTPVTGEDLVWIHEYAACSYAEAVKK